MTITGDFIRAAKPKTFATLKVVLDAVAERYEVDQEKTVWTKTLWKYVSQEWDFRYYEKSSLMAIRSKRKRKRRKTWKPRKTNKS
jgi:hypothetical protein